MRAVHVVTGCIAAVAATGCLGYLDDAAPSADTGQALARPAVARRALRRECRRIEPYVDEYPRENAEAWRIRRCDTPGCERTVPYEQSVYVRRSDDRRARHEYVHACLFVSGKIDGHHEWMRSHCQFCYDSPACRDACK